MKTLLPPRSLFSVNRSPPLIGTIGDNDLLVSNAKTHDAVIHCAMDPTQPNAADIEREIVKLFGDTLAGTNKVFMMSSGLGVFADGKGDEFSTPTRVDLERCKTDILTLSLKDRGVRSIALRLAMNTHNIEEIHIFNKMMLGASEKLGYIPYYTENIAWSACHSDDAGLLYVLAMESAEPGSGVHALGEVVKVKDIAEALAKRTGKKAGPVPQEKLKELGFLGYLLTWDQTHISAEYTKSTYGWEPKGQTLLEEFEQAPQEYFGL
ncbi:hypothetical protein CI109_100728 [Kwoniella shandongensis]|uniref:NAD-dependent epimerase/dehydratase domain-containing protein n=1 Tax=Kwoniella shandongensis TaxID=1734106 RepID=A0AAJ8MUX8_9TREE